MDPATIGIVLSILSGTATALWTVWTWSEQHEAEKEQQRDETAALYVNPFLMACEELQSRLYSILDENELEFFKQETPEVCDLGSPEAIELLYVIVVYFGWASYVYRYGPYTNDRKAIELNRKVSSTFSNFRDFSREAFYFSFSEQRSLGQTFVRPLGRVDSIHPEFETDSLYKFAEELRNDINRLSPLYQNIRKTIDAIERTDRVEELEGRERLAAVQNHLVELLGYIEGEEGISVANRLRKKASLGGNSVSQSNAEPEFMHHIEGRVRLRIPRLRQDELYAEHLRSRIRLLAGVQAVDINPAASSMAVNYSPVIPKAEFKQRILEVVGQSG